MVATVGTTGNATGEFADVDMPGWENIIAPTITNAAAATSVGTISASGATNIAARNSPPVTRFARPVRALLDARPDSMNTVFDDAEVDPPTTAPAPSTISAVRSLGNVPCGSAIPPGGTTR